MSMVESELPDVEFVEVPTGGSGSADPEAPYGRKKDGTPAKKRGRAAGSTGGTTRIPNKEALQQEIAEKLVEISMPLGAVSPLALAVIDARADKTAKALVTLAGKSARIKRILDRGLVAASIVELVLTPFAVALAVMIDFNQIPADILAAQKLGITQLWIDLYQVQGNNGNNGFHQDYEQEIHNRSGLFGNA